jgi:phosphoribosylaminoimidazole carboxylase PurE protein
MSPNSKVSILMGSASDLEIMARAAKELQGLDISYELEVTSAHRSPHRTVEYVSGAESRGVEVFIVGAGMAAHLAGVVAAHTTCPVIGVPLPGSSLGGLDSLLSTVQMPKGVPVATLAIGGAGATNAGILAAQILARADTSLRERLDSRRREMAEQVAASSEDARNQLGRLLGG